MKKTLLLVFIHGFKGGETTFGPDYEFTEDLRRLVARALPKIDVQVLVYPRYETRGDLGECVSRFRDWLQNKVIDIEVAAATPSPTIDPSVRTLLIGHSMGGIVAAETLIGIATEQPIYSEDGIDKSSTPAHFNSLLFPYIQGVLAFDTPYLGISPGVVAHGAQGLQGHYTNAQAAYETLSSMWGTKAGGSAASAAASGAKALPAPPAAPAAPAAAAGGWGRWGTIAMYAGAGAAIAAGGAAAYYNREQITQGVSWVGAHLEFVGCLARVEELKKRVAHMVKLEEELGVGFANLYTRLGKDAGTKEVQNVGTLLPRERTFCVIPTRQKAGVWREAVNDKATDETSAHMTMFEPKENPGYETLCKSATTLIVGWLQNDWYESSGEDPQLLQ